MQPPLQVKTAPEGNQEEGVEDERTGQADQEPAEDRPAVDRHRQNQTHSGQDVLEIPRHLVHEGEEKIDHRGGQPHFEVAEMAMTDRDQSPDDAELRQQNERDQKELVERRRSVVPSVGSGGMGPVVVLDRRAAGRLDGTRPGVFARKGGELHRNRAGQKRRLPVGENNRRGMRERRSRQTGEYFILNIVRWEKDLLGFSAQHIEGAVSRILHHGIGFPLPKVADHLRGEQLFEPDRARGFDALPPVEQKVRNEKHNQHHQRKDDARSGQIRVEEWTVNHKQVDDQPTEEDQPHHMNPEEPGLRPPH